MRQVWLPRRGGPEVLEVRHGPTPEPGEGEVRVRVSHAGVNFADILARMGLYPDAPRLPAVVGYEVAGHVARLGPGVADLAEGQPVVALTRFGGYSEEVVVPRPQLVPLPPGVGLAEAAALPVNYLTAWLMLVRLGNVRAGDRVLVHSAGGGVGLAALQLCRARGAHVIGTAGERKHERLRHAGVEHCIDPRRQDVEAEVARVTGGRGVDIALDALGGASFARSYRCLAPLGRLFVFGVSTLAPGPRRNLLAAARGLVAMPRFHPVTLMNDNRGVFGVNLGHLWSEGPLVSAALAELVDQVAEGTLAPTVDRTFPFDRAPEAHAYIQARKNFGKVLLSP